MLGFLVLKGAVYDLHSVIWDVFCILVCVCVCVCVCAKDYTMTKPDTVNKLCLCFWREQGSYDSPVLEVIYEIDERRVNRLRENKSLGRTLARSFACHLVTGIWSNSVEYTLSKDAYSI